MAASATGESCGKADTAGREPNRDSHGVNDGRPSSDGRGERSIGGDCDGRSHGKAGLATADGCHLRAPASAAEWEAYHLIREHVFRDSGGTGFRRSDEDEDRLPGHFPLMLWSNDEPVGTIRVDVLEGGRAALRLVAVHPSCQARGYGGRMLRLTVSFARQLGCGSAVVYSTLEAAGFYAREGFVEDLWDDCCIGGIVQMSKPL